MKTVDTAKMLALLPGEVPESLWIGPWTECSATLAMIPFLLFLLLTIAHTDALDFFSRTDQGA